MTTQHAFLGGCLCGAVRFSVHGGTKWCAHCHCTMCQRAHGAGYVTWVGVAEENFTLELGEESLHWYASSPDAERGFCRTCGSSLFFRSRRWPGEIHIARASFPGGIDRMPEAHVFYDSHVDWMGLDGALPIVQV